MDAPGSRWKPDGDLIYRTDRYGGRVGILPATCRNGDHSLHTVGYQAHDSEGCIRIVCQACISHVPPRRDNYWALRLTEPTPPRAELDDSPYEELRRRLRSK